MPYPAKQITSWSFSRHSTYSLCPAKAKFNFLDKIPEPGNEAMQRGNAIHEMAAAYIKGEGRTVPKELVLVADKLKELRKLKAKDPSSVVIEDTWAFRKDWTVTRWDDWKGCWLRIKVDCATLEHDGDNVLLYIEDWKTGKYRPERHEEYMRQVELYALGGLMYFGLEHPNLVVFPRLVYTDLGVVYPTTDNVLQYSMKDVPKLRKTWEARTKAMLKDTTFRPTPNNLCRWCHYRKENGGPCKY
jgi:CRISPR/Cas system-associated exonuclease Cas4 (RecB family)